MTGILVAPASDALTPLVTRQIVSPRPNLLVGNPAGVLGDITLTSLADAGITNVRPSAGTPAIAEITAQRATGSGTTSASATYPTATSAGHLLVAVVESTVTQTGAGDSAVLAGWTNVGGDIGTGATTRLRFFYKVADGTESIVTATTATGTQMTVAISEYNGAAAAPYVGESGTYTSGATSVTAITAGQLVTAGGSPVPAIGDLVIFAAAFAGNVSAAAWAAATPIGTVAASPNTRLLVGKSTVGTPGSGQTDTLTWTSARAVRAVAVHFAATAAAPQAGDFMLYDTSGGNISDSLPSAAIDARIAVKIVAGSGTVTLAGDHFNTPSGGSSLTLSRLNDAAVLQRASGYWIVLDAISPTSTASPLTTEGDLRYYHTSGDARLPIGANHTLLRSDGTVPAWGQVDLTADVTGVLPAANTVTLDAIRAAAAPIDVNAKRVINAADGSAATDLVTLQQMQAFALGTDVVKDARAATTGALGSYTYANGTAGVGATITSTALSILAAQDGVALAVNDRLLVKDETGTNRPYNGLYRVVTLGVAAVTAWQLMRVTDADEATELAPGMTVMVAEGNANADTSWEQQTAAPITVGTTNLVFGETDITLALRKASNLADLTNAATARSNLGLGAAALLADPITAAHGGLGLTSITAHSLIVGNGTAAATLLAPGTSGLPLLSQGASADPAYAALALSALATQADQTILGNNSGGVAAPSALTASQVRTLLGLVIGTNVQAYSAWLATLAALSIATRGAIPYVGASDWLELAPGAQGQILTSGGSGADPTWAAPGGGLYGTLVTGALAQTWPRFLSGTSSTVLILTSGTLYLYLVRLVAGVTYTSITFRTGTTGFTSPTVQQFVLCDSSRVALRWTSDDGSTAWAGSASKTLNMSSTYTPTASGDYYVGIYTTSGNNSATLLSLGGGSGPTALAPVTAGASTTGLTGAQTTPFTGAAIVSSANHALAWLS